ncbi:MAG: plasmid stabilization protein [Spirulina sp. DLM2.Bin59]|nr:MAG: plasmid stabilization protein [Spirulina sp. DLM2.Bin59]
MELLWTARSLRSFKRLVRKNPQLRSPIEQTLRQLAIDPFVPSLRSHKLKGELAGVWS